MPDTLTLPASTRGGVDRCPRVFECSWTDGGVDAAWVHVAGELDVATTPELVRTLRERQLEARLVVLDLRELAFIDSCGVRAIADASADAREAGRRLVLLRGAPSVDRLFTIAGCSEDVEIGDVDPRVEAPLQPARVDMNGKREAT